MNVSEMKSWSTEQWLQWHFSVLKKPFVVVPEVHAKWREEREKWLFPKVQPFKPTWKLREVLPHEIIVEFDGVERSVADKLIAGVCERLKSDGHTFFVFDHGGRSAYVRLYMPELLQFGEEFRQAYIQAFLKEYAPNADMSFFEQKTHLCPIENAVHWRHRRIHKCIDSWSL